MVIKDERIDSGKAFDWGRTSEAYARFRDIYPEEFYKRLTDRGLCVAGQKVLDLGTGTGVLPRNMYKYGAQWTGRDISPEQIEQAKRLASEAGMNIDFAAAATEDVDFPDESFDVITACQCYWYFDHEKVAPILARMLKPGGRLVFLYMAWKPFEDEIAGRSEKIILKYSPKWSGGGEKKHELWIPDVYFRHFDKEDHEEYDLDVHFTRESWHGRMYASRGVSASLDPDELAKWDEEHRAMLEEYAPEEFDVKHFAAISVLKKR